MAVIVVEPWDDGWTVRSDRLRHDMLFSSGRLAEIAAKRLGERLAESGEAVEIRVLVRGGALAGRFVRPSAGVADPAPVWVESGQAR